jgi:hypothetical protein
MRSFDLFDTLLGRLHHHPDSIFELVEKNFPYPGFHFLRTAASYQTDASLPDIYRKFQKLADISEKEISALMQFELETELSQIFPIVENINLVKDGDLIISDTYYDEAQVKKILEKIGLTRNVRIYATPLGKHSGEIWDFLKKEASIDRHLGDSFHSDVSQPESRGIPASHYMNGQLSLAEFSMRELGHFELSCLMRAVRLQNPFPTASKEYLIWNEQSQINIPLLVAASLYLHEFCQKHGKNRILFTSRDGCLWIQIFQILFPQYESIYFHASRYTYIHPTPSYIDYVKSVYTNESVIVDAHGRGFSCSQFFKRLKLKPTYLAIVNSGKKYHGILRTHELCEQIEQLNSDLTGTLYDVQGNVALRTDPEYDLRYIRPIHQCIAKCKELLPQYSLEPFDMRIMQWAYQAMNSGLVIEKVISHARYHCHILKDGKLHHVHLYI